MILLKLNQENQRLFRQNKLLEKSVLRQQKSLNRLRSSLFYIFWRQYQQIKNRPSHFFKILKYFFRYGPEKFLKKIKQIQIRENLIARHNLQYQEWFKIHWPKPAQLETQKKEQTNLSYRPLISLITPVYNVDGIWLEACIKSVLNQTYDNWELCLADDCSTKNYIKIILDKYHLMDSRIKVVYRSENGHISRASNSSLKIASGEFIGLLDNDDELAPHALFEIVKCLNHQPDLDFIYTDEDKIDKQGNHFDPNFKPDWSHETFLSGNYITHFSVIRKNIIDRIGGFRVGYEGSQDYDLFLRISRQTDNIFHIPNILYSWRVTETSTASATAHAKQYAYTNAVKAINDHLAHLNITATSRPSYGPGLYQLVFPEKPNNISVFVAPSSAHSDTILRLSKYSNVKDIYLWNHDQSFPHQKNINVLKENSLYSAIGSFTNQARTNYLLFLDSSIKLPSSHSFLSQLIGFLNLPQIGLVCSKILFSDNSIAQTGIVFPRHHSSLQPISAFQGLKDGGYFNFNYSRMLKTFSAASLLGSLVRKDIFSKLQPVNPDIRTLYGTGLDISYQLFKCHNRIVCCPYYPLVSISSSFPDDSDRKLDWQIIKDKFENIIPGDDPNYNPNLSKTSTDFGIEI